MRTGFIAAVVGAAILAGQAPAFAETGEAGINVAILGGYRSLNDNDWKPADEQTGFGVQFDVQPETWPFSFAIGLISAESPSEETDIQDIGRVSSKSRATQLDVGIRKYIEADRLRPFLGLGLSVIRAELETTSPAGSDSDTGTGIGPWVGLGVLYMVSDWLGIGARVQYTTADVEIFGQDLDAGSGEVDALLNFRF